MKAPDWNSQEFETLLQHPGLADEGVAEMLPRREMGAVAVVRQGVHAYHRQGMNTSMLSKMMIGRLERGSVLCPVCQTRW